MKPVFISSVRYVAALGIALCVAGSAIMFAPVASSATTSVVAQEKQNPKKDKKNEKPALDDELIPPPINPYPSFYELKKAHERGAGDGEIPPPINPYPRKKPKQVTTETVTKTAPDSPKPTTQKKEKK